MNKEFTEEQPPDWYDRPIVHDWEFEEPVEIHMGHEMGFTPVCHSAKQESYLWPEYPIFQETIRNFEFRYDLGVISRLKSGGTPPAGHVWCKQCQIVSDHVLGINREQKSEGQRSPIVPYTRIGNRS